jgi:adenylate kinase family enzyme
LDPRIREDEIGKDRLKQRGREDDQDTAIQNRFDIFKSQTQDAIKAFHYQPHTYRFIRIDGDRSREIIRDEVIHHYKETILPF